MRNAHTEFTVSSLERGGFSIDNIGRILAQKITDCISSHDHRKPEFNVVDSIISLRSPVTPVTFILSPPGTYEDQCYMHWRLQASSESEVDSYTTLIKDLEALMRILQRHT